MSFGCLFFHSCFFSVCLLFLDVIPSLSEWLKCRFPSSYCYQKTHCKNLKTKLFPRCLLVLQTVPSLFTLVSDALGDHWSHSYVGCHLYKLQTIFLHVLELNFQCFWLCIFECLTHSSGQFWKGLCVYMRCLFICQQKISTRADAVELASVDVCHVWTLPVMVRLWITNGGYWHIIGQSFSFFYPLPFLVSLCDSLIVITHYLWLLLANAAKLDSLNSVEISSTFTYLLCSFIYIVFFSLNRPIFWSGVLGWILLLMYTCVCVCFLMQQ